MEYYIQNTEAGYLGNAILFWSVSDCGYTASLDKSKKFSMQEAAMICLKRPNKFKAWPVQYIDNNEGVQRIIDSQYLDRKNIETFKP